MNYNATLRQISAESRIDMSNSTLSRWCTDSLRSPFDPVHSVEDPGCDAKDAGDNGETEGVVQGEFFGQIPFDHVHDKLDQNAESCND